MDWKVAMEAERAVLERIVALLLALADLAELSRNRSCAVRGLVLWLLLPAEALVRDLVAGTPVPAPLRQTGNGPADAMRLASSFRLLAAALLDLSCRLLSITNEPGGVRRIGIWIFDTKLDRPASMSLRELRRSPYDTS